MLSARDGITKSKPIFELMKRKHKVPIRMDKTQYDLIQAKREIKDPVQLSQKHVDLFVAKVKKDPLKENIVSKDPDFVRAVTMSDYEVK